MRSKILLILASVLLFFGCGKNPTELKRDSIIKNRDLFAKTDKQIYAMNEPVTIKIYNETDSAAYFVHCGFQIGFFIEGRQNEGWIDKGNVGILCLAIFQAGIRAIECGQSYSDIIAMHEAGTYRLKFPFAWQERDTLTDTLFSNEFLIQ